MSEYEERKQARIDRYREKAEKARQESRQLSHESISMLEHMDAERFYQWSREAAECEG